MTKAVRSIAAACFAAACAGAAPSRGQVPAAVAAIEDALVAVIERCEKSVVSITAVDGAIDALANVPAAGLQPGAQRRAPAIFFPPQAGFPGQLGDLQQVVSLAASPNGAGVVIDADAGLVLTQYRVVRPGGSHVVTDLTGQRFSASIRGADPRSGLAVLAIGGRIPSTGIADGEKRPTYPPALPLGEAEGLRKGRLVVALGNPFSIESDGQPTASWGSVTNTAVKAPAGENLNDAASFDGSYRTTLHHFGSLLQTDARLGWNGAGGAVVDLAGRLVGVTTTAATIAGHESPAGYAIPMNAAMRRVVADLSEGIEPEYGLLGVRFSSGGSAQSQRTGAVGIAVGDAFPGGPAHAAGLEADDLVLSINGVPTRTTDTLQLTVGSLPPGSEVPVVVERKGERIEATITLGKAYVENGDTLVTRLRYPEWRGMRIDYPTAIPPLILNEKAAAGALDPEGCVAVVAVAPESVSWNSGVRPYRFISHVGSERVATPQEFFAAVSKANEQVKLKFTADAAAAAPEPD